VKHVEITKKGITWWFHKLNKNLYIKTPDDALVVQNILSFQIQILSQFVKPPSDTLVQFFKSYYLHKLAPEGGILPKYVN
jgi:hypothetical protein